MTESIDAIDESTFRQILAQAPGHIVYCDTEYKFRYVNRTTGGYEIDTLIGQNMLTLAPENEAATRQAFEAAATTGQTSTTRSESEMPDGSIRAFSQQISAHRGECGELLGYVLVVTETTDQMLAERERDFAIEKSRATSWMAGQAEMARTVIHNVGNVLNGALVKASMLDEQINSAKLPQLRKAVGMLVDNRNSLQTFVDATQKGRLLLTYLPKLVDELSSQQRRLCDEVKCLQESLGHVTSVIRAQKGMAARVGCLEKENPNSLLNAAVRLSAFGAQSEESLITREFAVLEDLYVDRHLMLQILINLLQNAWEELLELPLAERRLCIRSEQLENHVELSVWNSGADIPSEQVGKIFEAGYSTKAQGTGLGLHTGANAARSVGGSLQYRSSPEGGARFVLSLPLRAESQPTDGLTEAAS